MSSDKPASARIQVETYVGIQALRFFAALAVVVSHAVSLVVDRHLSATLRRWPAGHAGVDVFFAISGFVMFLSIEGLAGEPRPALTFLRSRMVRIVPLYWLATSAKLLVLIALPWAALGGGLTLRHVLGSYLFLPAMYRPEFDFPLMPVGWTLNYEMFFYALCVAAIALRMRTLLALGAVLLPCALAGALLLPAVPGEASYLNPIVLEFLFGMLVARAIRAGASLPPLACLALGAAALTALALVPGDGSPWRWLCWGVPAAAVVAATALAESWLRARPLGLLVSLGAASYALYLGHTFVVPAAGSLFVRLGGAHPMLLIVASATGAVAASWVLHRMVELPLNRWIGARLWPPVTRARPAP